MNARSLACRLAYLALVVSLTSPVGAAQRTIFAETGPASFDQIGRVLTRLGDVNGDGFDDLAVGLPSDDTADQNAGRVEVRLGPDGAIHFAVEGVDSNDQLGIAVVPVGDLDGDGSVDLAVSAPGKRTVYVVSTSDGTVLREYVSPDSTATLYGASLGLVGDVNGDGTPDLAVGSSYSDITAPRAGKVYVFSGASNALLAELTGSQDRDFFGTSMCAAGDVNGDGFADFWVGAPGSTIQASQVGEATLHAGPNGVKIDTLMGDAIASLFGFRVEACGDLDADGLDDFLVSAPLDGAPNARFGVVFAYSSATRLRIREWRGGQDNEQFGSALHSAGDVDGDGIDDVAIGSPRRTSLIVRDGALLIYSGADSTPIYSATGLQADSGFGRAVAFVGDWNGDGMVDAAVGSPLFGLNDAGQWSVHSLDLVNGGTLCVGDPNSTGAPGTLTTSSPSGFVASANDLTLHASSLPANAAGYFIVSRDFGVVMAAGSSSGRLCIQSLSLGRFASDVLSSGSAGAVSYSPDLTRIPQSGPFGISFVAALPGDTFNFQLWHRDGLPSGAPTSTLSGAVTVTFQ